MNPYLVSWLRFNDADNIAKDECGNTWTITGSPTLTTDNAVLGKALKWKSPIPTISIEKPLIGAGQDFSIDFYLTVTAESSGARQPTTFYFGSTGNVYAYLGGYLSETGVLKLQLKADSSTKIWLLSREINQGELCHVAWSYTHSNNTHYYYLNGDLVNRGVYAMELPLSKVTISAISFLTIDEFRIFNGIALWTENFTPPTTEADYDLTELSFSVFMPATRSIVKPADEFSNVKRTVDKTADEFSNVSSEVVRSENIFSNVNRTVDKSADEFANVKREVTFSAVNDISPTRRTVNVSDNFANVKRGVVKSTDNFSPTKRQVLFSDENIFQPQRRLTNLADEFAQLRRLVHEPQVVDVYTRRRLTNLDDNFADVRREILSTTDNAVNLNRAVIFTADNFSPTKRTVNKTATESANVKRQILFSAENDCANVRRVINVDENFANVTSNIIKTTDIFAPTLRETLRSEICFVETSRRAELLSVIVALKSQQGNVLGYIRFQKDKTSSIGHLVTHFNGLNFYAGLVEVDEPTASKFRVRAYGMVYALKEEFL